jgi:small GTP-binding protein
MSSSTLKVGIIGLPNVGKSTLFNAILGRQMALTAPYPFATVEPNIGVVDVPDNRLEKLRDAMFPKNLIRSDPAAARLPAGQAGSDLSGPPIVPATVTFVDIAGLVKGAAEGQGLGNKFLGHIRDVDLILHVLRDFDDPDVPRAADSKNPEDDAEIVRTELELKDLEITERAKNKSHEETPRLGGESPLLSKKPVIYAVNVSEDKLSSIEETPRLGGESPLMGETVFYFSAKLEEEISKMPKNEQKEYLKIYGLERSCLDRIISECFRSLGLVSFFTAPLSSVAPAGQAGKWEVRAWPVRRDSPASKAAGVIHSDFERLFIRAEVIGWKELVACGSWHEAKERGWVRTEGRDYLVKDGDVCNFLIGK